MKNVARVLAALAVRRPVLLVFILLGVTVLSIRILQTNQNFDSDILNLLPSENPAVRGLKIYNSEFTQTRELAFILSTPGTADAEEYQSTFASLLRKQSWVSRVLDGSPTETEEGHSTLPTFVLPLLLNLPPGDFYKALESLRPEGMQKHISRLAAQTRAGSPIARYELENDPLGLITRAAQPLWKSLSISDAFDLVSPDGKALIVPVITNQTDLSADACRQMMQNVRTFIDSARTSLGPDCPEIVVTGRAAYVDEISRSMQRDIALTSSLSFLAVTALFWIGFRRLLPLAGSILILALTCLVSLAVGSLVFDKLNVIAIGFCSILVGLGDDFSLLLYQRYLLARNNGADRMTAIEHSIRHTSPGILWVALTTSLGFLTMCLSGSPGFSQLGTLIAIGVTLCAIAMIVFLVLFFRGAPPPLQSPSDPLGRTTMGILNHPRPLLIFSLVLFFLAAFLAMIPWRTLHFDTSPGSLEPRNIPAARALALMMEKFPATFEPLMIILPENLQREDAISLESSLKKLQEENHIEHFSSPSGLLLNPAFIQENLKTLSKLDLPEFHKRFDQSLEAEGLDPGSMVSTQVLLHGLKTASPQTIKWEGQLPESSPWWFLLDRMLAPHSQVSIAYVRLPAGTTPADREVIESAVLSAIPSALLTGWSQTLSSLVPWAKRELMVFGSLVLVIILVVLALIYRSKGPWLVHAGSLFFAAAGTVATLKLTGTSINLLNVLAFPLMLAVGVDYGSHLLLAAREEGNLTSNLAAVTKPVFISGLTTITGFGSLVVAQNPALSGLGMVCAIGVAWCLLASLLFLTPLVILIPRLAGNDSRR